MSTPEEVPSEHLDPEVKAEAREACLMFPELPS